MLDISTVAGYEAIVRHFGRWPSFHDAVLEKLMLDAHGKFHLSLRTWNTSTDMDERGYFKTTHHATVDFTLSASRQWNCMEQMCMQEAFSLGCP